MDPSAKKPFGLFACIWLLMALCGGLAPAGCSGGGSDAPAEASVVMEPDQKLSIWPHSFDIYRPTDAEKAIIFLHGAGGDKRLFAYALGINQGAGYEAVNGQIILDSRAVMVFPQGQAGLGVPTWTNHVMTSGQDDVRFLRDLVEHIAVQYKVSRFYIFGHSNGGMMANRLWCEEPELFDGYMTVSGPASARYLTAPCQPASAKPYWSVIGAKDNVLQAEGHWEDQTWNINPLLVTPSMEAFVDPELIGERFFLPERAGRRCGQAVRAGDADAVQDGRVAEWSLCDGSVRLLRVEDGGHTLESIEAASGRGMLELVLDLAR